MSSLTLYSAPPLTVAAFVALPENTDIRTELQEGAIVVKPRPSLQHQVCLGQLLTQLDPQVPKGLTAVFSLDVDLQLVPPDGPGTVRTPDLVVFTEEGYERARDGTEVLRASDVVLIGQVVEPSSSRTDRMIKHAEYADAGIDHYWMIDLHDGPSLTSCHLAGLSGYIDAEPVTGVVETAAPFSMRLDLPQLRR